MLATLTLVVLVATHEHSAELALSEAAQAALGEDVSIHVRAVSTLPDDLALIQLVASLGADGIATITWFDSAQPRAAIHLYRVSTRHWLEREVEFSEADAPVERERTLGFALASLLPDTGPAGRGDAVVTEVPSIDSGGVGSAATFMGGRALLESNTSIDATANAGVALGGAGDGYGGTLGTQVDLAPHLGLRFDLGVRAGHLERLEANTLALDLAPGVVWRAVDKPWGEPFAIELRLAFAARYLSITREAGASSGAESNARWLPGVRVGTAGLWWLSRDWALLATAALDASFDETKILRNGMRAASLEPFALLLQLGARARL